MKINHYLEFLVEGRSDYYNWAIWIDFMERQKDKKVLDQPPLNRTEGFSQIIY